MKILALDLGKFKTASVVSNGGEPRFTILSTPFQADCSICPEIFNET